MTQKQRLKAEEDSVAEARRRFSVRTYTIKNQYEKFYWAPAFYISAGPDCRGHPPGNIQPVIGQNP